jgi:hypothetical protein
VARPLPYVLISCLLGACSFDSTGKGLGSSGGVGPGDTADGDSGTGGGDTSGGDGGGTGGDGGGTSDDGGGTSGTGDPSGPCQEVVNELVLVEDATVTPPMQTAVSEMGEGTIAFSEVAEQGTVVFLADLPCADTYYIWGRVNDFNPGTHGSGDPDSYYVTVDTGQESTWFYGCGTFDSPQWTWQPVQDGELGADCEEGVRLEVDLDAGVHTIVVRNREDAFFENFAAIARILVTNDPDYVPTNE